jgi:hypothetical protein
MHIGPGISGDPNSLHSKYAQEGRWSNYPLNLSPRAQARGWGEGGPEGHKHRLKKIKKEVDRRAQPDSMGFYNKERII